MPVNFSSSTSSRVYGSGHFSGSPKDDHQSVKDILNSVDHLLNTPQHHILGQLLEGPKGTDDLARHLAQIPRANSMENYHASKAWILKELSAARDRLEEFYSTPEGFSQRLRLEIPCGNKGKLHTLQVTENIPPQDATAFWAAHLGNGKPTRLVTGRAYSKGNHQWLIQDQNAKEEILLEEVPPPGICFDDPNVGIAQPYIALSHVRAMLHLFSYFDSWNRDYGQPAPALLESDEEAKTDEFNSVVIGTPFETTEIAELEMYASERTDGCLFFDAKCRKFRKASANGEYRVWVSRRWWGPSFDTRIQSSHSAVLEAVCKTLTSDEDIAPSCQQIQSSRIYAPCSSRSWVMTFTSP
jgi:hypothetical protein